MIKLTAIGFALGLALAATTAAHATGKPTCTTKTDWSKPCEDPVNAQHWNFNSQAEATAWAAAIAQGGDASASATGGNASNGGINITNPRAPRVTANVGLVVDLGDLGRMKTDNLAKIVTTVDGASDRCFAAKVMNESPALFNWRTGKRLHLSC